MNFSELAAGRFRSAVFLLIIVMFCVPPLVRATDFLKAGTSSPLKIRLNRGFNVPQTKSRVTPPTQPVAILATEDVASIQTLTTARADDEALPASPPNQSPTVLRGPPATLTVS